VGNEDAQGAHDENDHTECWSDTLMQGEQHSGCLGLFFNWIVKGEGDNVGEKQNYSKQKSVNQQKQNR
jgi:hypothetical protein